MEKLSEEEIGKEMNLLTLPWKIENGKTLILNISDSNFREVIRKVNAIAVEAEALDHHPDMRIYDYKNLEIRLSTHKAGGLTDKDFILAGKIENILNTEHFA